MRKIAVEKDEDGINRLFLNNRPLFQYGFLDQGCWPDGVYTAPTDAALRYDIETAKRLGANMVRKHVKFEPLRFYHHCDKLGMLVWQDMPSGSDHSPRFEKELKGMIDAARAHPSIVMWVLFNKGWGQHEAPRHADWVKRYDPTRLVDHASGWADRGDFGDVRDIHIDDSGWTTGPGAFGDFHTTFPTLIVPPRTKWAGSDIWIRRTFTLPDARLVSPYLLIHHDEGAEVYFNGKRILERVGATNYYTWIPMDEEMIRALKSGINTVAVHCHNEHHPQCIDVGIVDVLPAGERGETR